MSEDIRIAKLGGQSVQGIWAFNILSTTNLSEWHALIMQFSDVAAAARTDPNVLAQEYTANALRRKIAEVFEWVKKGGALVVIADQYQEIQYPVGGRVYSFNLFSEGPLAEFKLSPKTGSQVKWSNSQPGFERLERYRSFISYSFTLLGTGFLPLAFVASTIAGEEYPVAGVATFGKGRVIVAPDYVGNSTTLKNYIEALVRASDVGMPSSAAEVVAWVEKFKTKNEASALENLAAFEGELREAQSKIESAKLLVRNEQPLKRLFSATGSEFEEIVHDSLERLGFQIAKVPGKRTDRLALVDGQLFAIEMKGVERGIIEENSRQTDRWVADVRAALVASDATIAEDAHLRDVAAALTALGVQRGENAQAVECRGMLIVNTYRSCPLDERVEPDISHDTRLAISRSGIVTFTGLHLFDLVTQAQANPDMKIELRKSLLSATGFIQGRSGRDFLVE